ncbi:MAG: class I SAM-dependent methyltransferase [Chloroflexota bacterium]|nr:class I SAM-dependent methyltransferase [Chloroflexota bacterium]
MSAQGLDLAAIKQRQQQTWSAGDFSAVGTRTAIVGETICEAVDLRAGNRVLDVACGSGTAAIAAARRFCEVVGVDYVPALLERGRERAAAERLEVEFREGDAEALPFPDASFDVVLSTFGVMFAPDQAKAAAELLRVCRPGGTIGLANWTPESRAGQIFKITAKYMPPPPGLAPPTRWGTEEGLRALLGDGIADLQIERRHVIVRAVTPEAWLDFFRTNFGPMVRAFAALDEAQGKAYAGELLDLVRANNQADDGTLSSPSEYLEVVAKRR